MLQINTNHLVSMGMAEDAKRDRPGRPPKEPTERRRNRVMMNLTDHEMALLERAASDRAPADYAREVLLRHLQRLFR